MKIRRACDECKRVIKSHLILTIVLVGVPIILCFGYVYFKSSIAILDYLQRKNKEYTMVEKEDEINGVILSIYSDRGGSFVCLKDSLKIWFEVSENKKYEKYLLYNFLQPNDSLIKNTNNDTLFIFRKNESFFFVLGQINQRH